MNNWKLNSAGFKQKQQGYTLVLALGFMVFLTLIVLSMVNITNSDEKIARNSRDKDIAFAAAEAAMRDAEMYLTGSYQFPYTPVLDIDFSDQCTNALCDFREAASPPNIAQRNFYNPGDTIGNKSMRIGTVTLSPTVTGLPAANQPRYLIETVWRNDPGKSYPFEYRITVQSRGISPDTMVVLQELYYPTGLINAKD